MQRKSSVVTLPASESPLQALVAVLPGALPSIAPAQETRRIHTRWLAQLRWGALLGQLLTVLLVDLVMHIQLPLVWLFAVLATEAASNLWFVRWSRRAAASKSSFLALPMAIDIVLLTMLLSLTGGPFNPFSFLYLVYLALAAVVLPPRLTWGLVGLSLVSFGMLFATEHWLPLTLMPQLNHADQMRMHMQGMWFAFAVAALFITYFVTRLRHNLSQRELELFRARSLAAQSEKLASLATLATGAAHELSTPLSTIAVVAKELERSLRAEDQTARSDAQLIRQEVERCREILQRMAADAGHTNESNERVMSVQELLTSAVEGLPRSRDVQLSVEVNAGACVLYGQAQATAQALRGILKNALQASPQDKSIEVDARLSADGASCNISVRDYGVGMSQDVLSRAGEPFFTTKEPGEGMGLGLFLTRVVAERAGGQLDLQSQLGHGTTATLVLPVTLHATNHRTPA
jgi:two-component system sensor histidine kinase RegB